MKTPTHFVVTINADSMGFFPADVRPFFNKETARKKAEKLHRKDPNSRHMVVKLKGEFEPGEHVYVPRNIKNLVKGWGLTK